MSESFVNSARPQRRAYCPVTASDAKTGQENYFWEIELGPSLGAAFFFPTEKEAFATFAQGILGLLSIRDCCIGVICHPFSFWRVFVAVTLFPSYCYILHIYLVFSSLCL